MLGQRATHRALLELVRAGSELTGTPLDLREAVPTRLDFTYQWQVPSVSELLANLKGAFQPARKRRTETISAHGGRSLVYGYGTSKQTIRFYDKAAEVKERGDDSGEELDTLLRLEIQDRRRSHLRLIHERGYPADDVRADLAAVIEPLQALRAESLAEYARRNAASGRRLTTALGDLYLAEHPDVWPTVKAELPRSTYYVLRKRARAAKLAVSPWMPSLPADAFEDGPALLWQEAT